MKLLNDLDVSGKKVFLRADLDVDVSAVADPAQLVRLKNLKPTVDFLLGKGAKQVVIAGHIGRPSAETRSVESASGKPPLYNPMLTTEQLAEPLKKILGKEVVFCADFGHLPEAQILLFENLRFWPGEVANDQVFANRLAILGQVYVNEAFGNCHREHASMVKLPALVPHAAGLHLQQEITELTKLVTSPERPFVAIVGGFKKETKLPVIVNLSKLADHILVGGALVKELASDNQISALNNVTVGTLTPDGEDLSQQTASQFVTLIKGAKTVVWNGPLGEFEKGFVNGSIAIAAAIIESGAYSVVGGGETTEFLMRNNLLSRFSFVSSGGGAMLEFLAGRKLPGIEALA